MANDSSFKRLPVAQGEHVTVYIEGKAVIVKTTDSAASAALLAGIGYSRTSAVSASKRAPFCMMGACFECLMTIDGVANSQGCMTPVKEGMTIERQQEARTVEPSSSPDSDATGAN